MPPDFGDPYTYPGTGVLRNKAGLREWETLKHFEHEQSASRLRELRMVAMPGHFDLAHLQAIHAYVFQDVYEWAGRVRTINIMKGDTAFALAPYIENEAHKLSAALQSENHLQGLNTAQFVSRFAHYYTEWNVLHPFLDGNGRSTREFFRQMAHTADYEFDLTLIAHDPSRWMRASEQSVIGNLASTIEIFTTAIQRR